MHLMVVFFGLVSDWFRTFGLVGLKFIDVKVTSGGVFGAKNAYPGRTFRTGFGLVSGFRTGGTAGPHYAKICDCSKNIEFGFRTGFGLFRTGFGLNLLDFFVSAKNTLKL